MEDFLRATQAAVLDNEAKVLATKMGLPHVSLLQRANPDNDSHNLTIQHLFGILLHSGDMRPLEALASEFRFDLVSREAVTAKDLSGAVRHMHAEVADVTTAVTQALEDGRVSRVEKELIKRELAQAQNSLDVLLESVRLAGAVLRMQAEVADVSTAVAQSLWDGRASRVEKELIKREIAQAQNSLDVLLEWVKVG